MHDGCAQRNNFSRCAGRRVYPTLRPAGTIETIYLDWPVVGLVALRPVGTLVTKGPIIRPLLFCARGSRPCPARGPARLAALPLTRLAALPLTRLAALP